MGKQSNFTPNINELKYIDINTFKKVNQLKPNTTTKGTYDWSINGQITNSISFKLELFEDDGFLEINYIYNKEIKIKYTILIDSKPSNLDKGRIYYFICPKTLKQCRKLHFYNGYFYHRTFFKNLSYECQKQSKKSRELIKIYSNLYDDHLYNEVYKKHFKKFYNNKPTKKYSKFLKLINKRENQNNYINLEQLLIR